MTVPNAVYVDFDDTLIEGCLMSVLLGNVLPPELRQHALWMIDQPAFQHAHLFLYQYMQDNGLVLESLRPYYVLAPLRAGVKQLFQWVKTKQVPLFVVSGCDKVLIEDYLSVQGLLDVVSGIGAFESLIDPVTKAITYRPYPMDSDCKLGVCDQPICKGMALSDIGSHRYDNVVYLGDGRNDLCPCSRLSPNSTCFWRRGKGLQSLLRESPQLQSRVSAKRVWFDRVGEVVQQLRALCKQ